MGCRKWKLEVLSNILRATRILPSALTGIDPYFLVFKQPAKVPVPLLHMEFFREWVADLSRKLLSYQIYKWLRRLSIGKTCIRSRGSPPSYKQWMYSSLPQIHWSGLTGSMVNILNCNIVLLKSWLPTKSAMKALGPFRFKYYNRRLWTMAIKTEP